MSRIPLTFPVTLVGTGNVQIEGSVAFTETETPGATDEHGGKVGLSTSEERSS